MPGHVETPAYLLRALGNGAVTGDGVSEATRRAQRVSRLSSWAQLRQGPAAAELEQHGGAGGREGGGMGQVPARPPRGREDTIFAPSPGNAHAHARKFSASRGAAGRKPQLAHCRRHRSVTPQVTGVAISEGAADGQRYSLPSPRPSSVCPQIRAGRKHPISPLRACARARTRCSRPAGGFAGPRGAAFTGCALRRHVFVFHRGARRWAADTFDVSGRIRTREPIQQAMALSLLSVGANQNSSAAQCSGISLPC